MTLPEKHDPARTGAGVAECRGWFCETHPRRGCTRIKLVSFPCDEAGIAYEIKPRGRQSRFGSW